MRAMRQFRHACGLEVCLISDTQASQASALVQFAVGSHHEPSRWPGLAHLLEHVLFAGSAEFQHDDRLMAWSQARGARVNATTCGSRTAYFFECAAPLLDDGLARLTDMLVAPLLAADAVRQETLTIDAECRLLANHHETRRDAALSATFAAPHPWQRFAVGDKARFGEDIPALQQALSTFHRRFYCAANATLWLQGPQPLDELERLAQRAAARFSPQGERPAGLPDLTPGQPRDLVMQQSEGAFLRCAFLVQGAFREEITLLRQLVQDEAGGSLLAALRAGQLCDGVRLLLPYQSDTQSVVCIELSLCQAGQYARAESLLHRWLASLVAASAGQLAQYADLARRQFERLPVMDQLRERAAGFAPPRPAPLRWMQLCRQAIPPRMTRLLSDPGPQPVVREIQGFPLRLGVLPPAPPLRDSAMPPLWLYPQPATRVLPALPATAVALPQRRCGQHDAVLLLMPPADFPAGCGEILQAALRDLAGSCAHEGGELQVSNQQGLWLIQLHGTAALMQIVLQRINQRLSALPAATVAEGRRDFHQRQAAQRGEIAVRALLNALPDRLLRRADIGSPETLPAAGWRAVLHGGDEPLRQRLARLLTRFPAAINLAGPPPAIAQPDTPPPAIADSAEGAVLLFCPLVEDDAACLAAWQLLAMLYQPHFFQQLRVEQNLGYVVSSRFHQAAGRSGILFALQSPQLTAAALLQHIDDFLQRITATVAVQTDAQWRESAAALLASLNRRSPDALAQSLADWQHETYRMGALTAEVVDALTATQMQQWHRRLCDERHVRYQLVNASA